MPAPYGFAELCGREDDPVASSIGGNSPVRDQGKRRRSKWRPTAPVPNRSGIEAAFAARPAQRQQVS
jgi:hypothetical protein